MENFKKAPAELILNLCKHMKPITMLKQTQKVTQSALFNLVAESKHACWSPLDRLGRS